MLRGNLPTLDMGSVFDENSCGETNTLFREYEESYGSCISELDSSINSQRPSIWVCLKTSVECTVLCGVLVGLFGTFIWWLELNLQTYCFTEWDRVPEEKHHRRLIVDIFIGALLKYWAFSCIAPLCDWSTIKELGLIYICTIGALLDVIDRLLLFVFAHYSKSWKQSFGYIIFLVTSLIIYYRFARYCKAVYEVPYKTLVLTFKLNLQFIVGLLVCIPFNLMVLDLYYTSSSIERTILACVLIVAFAIPKLFLNHVVTNLRGICAPGDEIMLVIAYMTATTICSRLMQADIEKLSYFIVISVVHGLLNVADKLSLPLRRKILSWMFCNYTGNPQLTTVNRSLFLANQTLVSIITETTCVIIGSAAAYLLLYYYKRDDSTGQRYDGRFLLKEMVKRCSIAIGIEVIFNVIAVKIQTHLYKIPVIGVWKWKWNSIILIHMIQVFFIVLYFSQFINNMLLKDFYKEANITCFGSFRRV